MFQISFHLVPISLRWFYSSAQGSNSNKSVSKGWGRPRWLQQDGWLNGCFLFLILLQHYSSIFIVVVFQLWSVPSQCQRWIPPSILGSCLHHPVVSPTISSAWDPCLSPLWQLIEDSPQVPPSPIVSEPSSLLDLVFTGKTERSPLTTLIGTSLTSKQSLDPQTALCCED